MAPPVKPRFHRVMMAQESGPPRPYTRTGDAGFARHSKELSTPKPFVALLYTGLTRGAVETCVFRVRFKGFKSEMKSPLITDLTPADHYSMLELPADRPRPPGSSFRGATRALRLPAAVTASLRQAAGREGVSLDVLLLAGLAA